MVISMSKYEYVLVLSVVEAQKDVCPKSPYQIHYQKVIYVSHSVDKPSGHVDVVFVSHNTSIFMKIKQERLANNDAQAVPIGMPKHCLYTLFPIYLHDIPHTK